MCKSACVGKRRSICFNTKFGRFHPSCPLYFLSSSLVWSDDDTKDREMKMWDLKDLFLKNVYDVLFCLNHHSINFIFHFFYFMGLLYSLLFEILLRFAKRVKTSVQILIQLPEFWIDIFLFDLKLKILKTKYGDMLLSNISKWKS